MSYFFNRVIELFQNAKKNLSVAVNMTMVYSYYEAGRMIIEEEQGLKERAAYGKYILKELSERLTQKFGRGYLYDNSIWFILRTQLGKRRFPNLKNCQLRKKEESFI